MAFSCAARAEPMAFMAPLERPLRVATDCSGMETPLMALKRLNVDFEHVFSCDNDPHVKKQILANYPQVQFFDDLMARDNGSAEVPCADLYVAGFPCQPFSGAGKGRGLEDARGTVFFGCADYIQKKQPRMYILENVKRILSNDKGRTWELIMNTLITMNRGAYHVDWKVLDTQEHGVPQSRPRVYIVGVLKTALPKDFQSFPWPEKLPLISIEPLLEEAERKPTMNTLPPSYPTTPYKGVKEVMDALHKAKQNPLCRTFLIDIDASPKFRSYMEDRVMCMTKSRPSGFWISSRGRRMTVDEMLRLQGMERCFEQVVSDKVLGAQIGNAMSQNILERLFIHLLPVAGLVPKSMALQDRWLQRTSDPTWPRRVNEVKKVALKVKEAPKRQASCASRAAGSKKRRAA